MITGTLSFGKCFNHSSLQLIQGVLVPHESGTLLDPFP